MRCINAPEGVFGAKDIGVFDLGAGVGVGGHGLISDAGPESSASKSWSAGDDGEKGNGTDVLSRGWNWQL